MWAMCFSPNDRYLAIADSGHIIWVNLFIQYLRHRPYLVFIFQIWEIRKKHVRNIFKGHTNLITSVDFSPNGRSIASSSYDNNLRIWSMRDGFSSILGGDTDPFHQVKFSPNGKFIVGTNSDGILRIWDARTRQLLTKWNAEQTFAVLFTPDGSGLFSGGWSQKVNYWSILQDGLGKFEIQRKGSITLTGESKVCICDRFRLLWFSGILLP